MRFTDVRARASETRAEALGGADASTAADLDRLIQATLANQRLTFKIIPENDVYGAGVLGMLNRRARLIGVSHVNTDAQRRAVTAHELGHWFLHSDPRLQLSRLNFPIGGGPVEGYSEAELKEVQADVFAAEFLCPCDLVARAFQRSVRPSELARRLGLPYELVIAQAAEALLGAPQAPAAGAPGAVALDERQAAAAAWSGSHLIVEGGPSSGKTTVIAARVAHLLDAGRPPASIAVLAQSEEASQRLRSAFAADARGVEVWSGTLLGYCKELLRKYPTHAKRTPEFKILDDVAAISLVKDVAGHRVATWTDAARAYRGIAALKHAAVGPDGEGSRHARTRTSDLGDLLALYRGYEDALQRADAMDAADLTLHAIRLLDDEKIAAMIASLHGDILIDDYGETTLADQLLLRRLSRGGANLFAAGSRSEPINAFSGAAADGVERFEDEHPGASRLSLGPRRSCIAIDSRAAAALASQRAGRHRQPQGVAVSVARDRRSEARAIAEQIGEWARAGLPIGEQVVLARTHASLDRLARDLRRAGIAVRHDGEALERTEVVDLLAVTSLRSDMTGRALARVARLPIYGLAPAQAAALASYASRHGLSAFEAVPRFLRKSERGRTAKGVRTGSAGLRRLSRDLSGLAQSATPFALACAWLFERSDYLAGKDATAREAIRHFLGVCEEHARHGDGDDANLERRLRRLRSRSQDSVYRRGDGDASDTEAVPLMTVHSVLGRKFRGVHVAALPPAAGRQDRSSANEEAVFAAAISRAGERLHLSRSLDGSKRWSGHLAYRPAS